MIFKDLVVGDKFSFVAGVEPDQVITKISPTSPPYLWGGETISVEIMTIGGILLGHVAPYHTDWTREVFMREPAPPKKTNPLLSVTWQTTTSEMTFVRRTLEGELSHRTYTWRKENGHIANSLQLRWYRFSADLETRCNDVDASICLFMTGWVVTLQPNNQGELA